MTMIYSYTIKQSAKKIKYRIYKICRINESILTYYRKCLCKNKPTLWNPYVPYKISNYSSSITLIYNRVLVHKHNKTDCNSYTDILIHNYN